MDRALRLWIGIALTLDLSSLLESVFDPRWPRAARRRPTGEIESFLAGR